MNSLGIVLDIHSVVRWLVVAVSPISLVWFALFGCVERAMKSTTVV